ncbi:MAG: hypothetical protein KBE72_10960, partial [Syntrophaceae bacterium]|nr:hypothetical protein [Syntrophaceae bacterium]
KNRFFRTISGQMDMRVSCRRLLALVGSSPSATSNPSTNDLGSSPAIAGSGGQTRKKIIKARQGKRLFTDPPRNSFMPLMSYSTFSPQWNASEFLLDINILDLPVACFIKYHQGG